MCTEFILSYFLSFIPTAQATAIIIATVNIRAIIIPVYILSFVYFDLTFREVIQFTQYLRYLNHIRCLGMIDLPIQLISPIGNLGYISIRMLVHS